jgi:nicotinamidase-related amidase
MTNFNLPGKSALLIIDAQKGFMPFVFDSAKTLNQIEKVLNAARKAKIPVIHTQEIHRKDHIDFGRELEGTEDVHNLEGSDDVEIVDQLKPIAGEYTIMKRRYSCFFGTDLEILLKGLRVQTLVVCGFLTDVCVHYTCADAHQNDYYVKVVYDGVSGSTKEAHEASLRAIKYLQTASETNAEQMTAIWNNAYLT